MKETNNVNAGGSLPGDQGNCSKVMTSDMALTDQNEVENANQEHSLVDSGTAPKELCKDFASQDDEVSGALGGDAPFDTHVYEEDIEKDTNDVNKEGSHPEDKEY